MPRIAYILLVIATGLCARAGAVTTDWPTSVEEVWFFSSADGSRQPAFFYDSGNPEPRPLLVGLHSWSVGFRHPRGIPMAEWCIEHDWVFIYPDFRGANTGPHACGSDEAVRDIIDAVAYAEVFAHVDPDRIYLTGASGGGHMALLMAGRAPQVWAGVSAWCGITDLVAWHAETVKSDRTTYANHIEAVCGGPPLPGSDAEAGCRHRSPLTWLPRAHGVRIDINTGIRDGHDGSVPVSHSLRAFNAVAALEDRFTQDEIEHIVGNARVPRSLRNEATHDPTYGDRRILLRRVSGNARITLLDGGHEYLLTSALAWLSLQRRGD